MPSKVPDLPGSTDCAIRWTAGLCSLWGCSAWWGPCQHLFCPHNPGGLDQRANESSQPIKDASRVQSGKTSGVSGS
jgi:hypothetical protein